MIKLISLGLIIVGALIIFFGVRAMDSFKSDIARVSAGTRTEKSIWLPIGLGVADDSESPPWR